MLERPKLNADELERYMWRCSHIDAAALTEEFTRLPADMAYWNEQYAETVQRHLSLKAERDRVYAEVYAGLRLQADAEGRKATVSELTHEVERERRYRAICDLAITAESEKARLFGVLEAIRAKRDMLVSLGSHQRAEMYMTGRHGEKPDAY